MRNNAIQNLLFEKEITQPPMGNVQNHSLQSSVMMGSICGTTTKDGSRSRYSSGIFLSQIPFKGYAPIPHTLSFIEFAVRATRGNKALCTNNTGCSLAVVEPLSLPLKGDNPLLTKPKRQFKMKTFQNPTALLAAYFPIVSTSTQGGLANA